MMKTKRKKSKANSHLSEVAVVGLAGLHVLVGAGLDGRGHGGQGRAGDQEGRDGGGAVLVFWVEGFFFPKEKEKVSLRSLRSLVQTAPALAGEQAILFRFESTLFRLFLSPSKQQHGGVSPPSRLSRAEKKQRKRELAVCRKKAVFFSLSLFSLRLASLSLALSLAALSLSLIQPPVESPRHSIQLLPSTSTRARRGRQLCLQAKIKAKSEAPADLCRGVTRFLKIQQAKERKKKHRFRQRCCCVRI